MAATAKKRDWMQGSSPYKGAALAMLLERPGHPYALTARLRRRLGPAWQIGDADLYRILKNLEKHGLAKCSPEPDPEHPHRTPLTYHPTALTAGAVDDWMRSPLPGEMMGVELCIRIALAREEHAPYLMELLDDRERECLRLLQQYAVELTVARWSGLGLELVRKYAIEQLQAIMGWIEVARASIEEFTARSS